MDYFYMLKSDLEHVSMKEEKTKWKPSAPKSLHILTQIYYNFFDNMTVVLFW